MDKKDKNYLILEKFNVSRETYNILNQFKDLILAENKEINLVSKKTIDNLNSLRSINASRETFKSLSFVFFI